MLAVGAGAGLGDGVLHYSLYHYGESWDAGKERYLASLTVSLVQSGPLSLVEKFRGLSLIGPEKY